MTDIEHPAEQPLRFGVQLRGADSAAQWLDEARRAEDASYDVLTMPDLSVLKTHPRPRAD